MVREERQLQQGALRDFRRPEPAALARRCPEARSSPRVALVVKVTERERAVRASSGDTGVADETEADYWLTGVGVGVGVGEVMPFRACSPASFAPVSASEVGVASF
jgi:hypothetical protein